MSLQVLSGKTDLKKISGGTVVVLPVQKEGAGIVTVGFSANPESRDGQNGSPWMRPGLWH